MTLVVVILYLNRDEAHVGKEIDSYKGVAVYYNGKNIENNSGENYSEDGYYYGEKWQCVEFVKRFYYVVKGHRMPDVLGNAKEFFDPAVPQGKMNHRRGLVQYRNGGKVKPEVDDLLVFTNTKYGHVAIITSVSADAIEIIQQNVTGQSRQIMPLTIKKGRYYIGTSYSPAGWLRKEDK
jgi:surface antigen